MNPYDELFEEMDRQRACMIALQQMKEFSELYCASCLERCVGVSDPVSLWCCLRWQEYIKLKDNEERE